MTTSDLQAANKKEEGLIFISWSGETSRLVGVALRDLIRNTIQTANPWMSDSDLDKGARWRKEIEAKLDNALAGVVVLTPGNTERPWLLFEAGALAKKNERVFTYLFRLETVDDPLAQFQRTLSTESDMLRMLKSLNAVMERPVDEARLERAFPANWVDFAKALDVIPASSVPATPPNPVEQSLQELLNYVREQSKDLAAIRQVVLMPHTLGELEPYLTMGSLPLGNDQITVARRILSGKAKIAARESDKSSGSDK